MSTVSIILLYLVWLPSLLMGGILVKIEALGRSTQFLLLRHLERHDIQQVQKKEIHLQVFYVYVGFNSTKSFS